MNMSVSNTQTGCVERGDKGQSYGKESSVGENQICCHSYAYATQPACHLYSENSAYHDGNTRVCCSQVNSDHITGIGSWRLPPDRTNSMRRRRGS